MNIHLKILLSFAAIGAATSHAHADAAISTLYEARCAICHGLDGRGQTPSGKALGARDWTDPTVLKPMSRAEVENVIRLGKGDKAQMPSYATLGDAKIKALAAHIRRFQPK